LNTELYDLGTYEDQINPQLSRTIWLSWLQIIFSNFNEIEIVNNIKAQPLNILSFLLHILYKKWAFGASNHHVVLLPTFKNFKLTLCDLFSLKTLKPLNYTAAKSSGPEQISLDPEFSK
jgi:hypothetical protein